MGWLTKQWGTSRAEAQVHRRGALALFAKLGLFLREILIVFSHGSRDVKSDVAVEPS